nr:protein rep [Polaromonas sp. W11N]
MHTPIGQVSVLRDKLRGSAFYGGLATCGSTLSCPICATKVQERRRVEIAQAFDWAYNVAHLQPVMVTLTFPHKIWHDLYELILQQRQALKLLRYGKPWKKLTAEIDYQGLIRALEISRGGHGWHPHTHEVWFVGRHVKAEDLQVQVLKQWMSACIRAGLLDPADVKTVAAFMEHAVHVKGWCQDSDYLAKSADDKNWGIDREMAKGATKLGKLKGLHPFQLLALAAEGDTKAGQLYVSFAMTMKRTRSRPLFWSPGLKGRVGINDSTDEQLASEQREEADVLGLLTHAHWQLVRASKSRAQLLDAAETGGWPAVMALLDRLALAVVKRVKPPLKQPEACPGPQSVSSGGNPTGYERSRSGAFTESPF